ncbi:glycosyltransferase involved in cell wall biosynthesis [Pontibacter ummariensis]|uniref:Glycosyltransferase involved in cell wall bisynthesis n=1 Tax=Pontibacter ummariensis TaxID=1610492 RepID=A0A239ELB0_9BACT|nr:glycosyltransferase family 4 protein [Pontibacter ummariensis]PRY13323.1 glycosyltransferase involved in cell wall biosynthesis [Pontibacter ummariensis]SNS45455.1 Glycosyltransferase involved in cell wall bisynthesis [Pontibacter ummariensis]
MKIGICGPIDINGISEHLYYKDKLKLKGLGGTPVNHQVVALLEKGYEVFVFTLTPELEVDEVEVLEGKNLKVYVGAYRKRALDRCKDLFFKERQFLKNSIIKSKPTILHAHWQYEYGWAAIDSGIPTLLTCHDSPIRVLRAQQDVYRLVRLIMATIVLYKAKHLTAVSPYTAKGLRLFTRKNVDVIPNFEPDEIFSLYKKKELGNTIKIIMINNSFYGLKNVNKGIEAYLLLKEKYHNVQLHLYGAQNGVGEDAYYWCLKNNASSGVSFHGKLPFDKLMEALSDADVFLHTSLEESCPMVIIEAMAMGIPIVAGKEAGGIPWMLEKGGGKLVDVRHAQSICGGLEKVLEKSVREKCSLTGRDVALKNFSKEVVIKKYLKAYKKLI